VQKTAGRRAEYKGTRVEQQEIFRPAIPGQRRFVRIKLYESSLNKNAPERGKPSSTKKKPIGGPNIFFLGGKKFPFLFYSSLILSLLYSISH